MNSRVPIKRWPPPDATEWLVDGGEMGKLIRSMDWSQTPLGPRESWPYSLRTTLNLCLASNFPIGIIWGVQRVQLYNDGYLPIAGGKHPHSMGQDFQECWISGWPVIGEAFAKAIAGETAPPESIHVFLDRNGYLEEAFFTSSFSPIRDDQGQVVGVFHPTVETTQQRLGERRLQALRALATATAQAGSESQAVTQAVEHLATQDADLPFVLIYLVDPDGKQARLAGATGLLAGSRGSPEHIALASPLDPSWPLAEALRSNRSVQVEGLAERFGPIVCSPYPEPVQTAMVMPIVLSGMDSPLGWVIAGVSPRRSLDEPYRTFYELLSSGIATALGSARAYEQERHRAEALAEIDRTKTAFFSNVSHEFRTPLTLMIGPLEELLKEPRQKLAEGDWHALETAHRNALRLLKLVNSLLDFSRIEAGRMQAIYTPTNLTAFTAELASVFQAAFEAAGLTLVVDCPPLPEPVFVDRDMWEKIVLNLLSNAFKFTFTGTITVKLRWSDGKAVLIVADTGTGVPPSHLPRLFERFHRLPNARSRTHEGSGIGLALVQELVKLHGGSIEVESEVNRGTTFTVTIPGGRAHLPAEAITAEPHTPSRAIGASAFLEEALHWCRQSTTTHLRSAASDLAAPSHADVPARILLVDDNADMREYVSRLLAPYWEVEAVADGLQALDAAQREEPDLVLTDVMMPNLDGFGLLKALRDDDRTRGKPVILLSARAGEEARVEGIAAGADDYLTKPFTARELLARVRTHLELAAQRRELVEALRESEKKYRTLFTNMTEGFALGEPILDEQGKPVDVRYLEANEAFHQQTGLPKDILGRPHHAFLPEVEQFWIDRFAAVALTGQPDRIDSYSAPTRRHYDVRVFSPTRGRFAILFRDVTEQKRIQEALLDSEARYKALFNNKTIAIAHQRIITDNEGRPVDYRIEAVNEPYEEMVGVKRDEAVGKLITQLFPQIRDVGFDLNGEFGRVALEGGEKDFEVYFPPLGRWFSFYAYSPVRGECTAIFTDITAQKAAEAALKESEKRLALALKAAGTAVWEMDVGTQVIIPASELFFTMLGYAPGDIRTSSEWLALIHEDDLPGVPELIGDVIEGRRDSYWRELRLRAKDGRWHWILSQATAADRDAQGRAVRLVGTHTDINERKLAEERVRAAALHDPLTGLPNRALFFEYCSHLVAAARRNHSHGALLFIDLDRFKPINDLYGHEAGDRVLQEVGRRLVGCTRQEDVVGRLGGDEFVVVLPHLDTDRHRAATVAQHVVEAISQPFRLDALELSISPSIGISFYPEHATDVSALIHTADLAMYQAKQSGRSTYKFYAPELDRQVDEAYSLEACLKNALKHGGLELHYQPVVDIQSGRLIGAEALAHLIGSDGRLISPARFIPVAESAGLIEELGEWVAAEACRQHAAWLSEGLRVVIAINVSPLQFRQRDFAQRLGTIVAENGVDANGLQVEVTESTVMENVEEAIKTLSELKSIGMKVALDDFGTGYSSLSSLSSLPLDKLKVDQSFMRCVDSDPTSRAITRAMIALGRALNLEIVGEGIESEQTFGYLRSEGCDQAQGFWVSHPLPPAAFAQWTREQRLQ